MSSPDFMDEYLWRLKKTTYKEVLCGKEFASIFKVYNSYYNQLPLDRKDLTLTIEYPYEVQPQQISSLKCEDRTKFDVKYIVANSKTKEERTVTKEDVFAGYAFELEENEYVKKIEIMIPEMEKKDQFSFQTENITQTKNVDGNESTEDKTVYITGKLSMNGEEISEGIYEVKLKALKDQLKVNSVWRDGVVLEADEKTFYHSGYLGMRAVDKYTKNYEDTSFQLSAPPEVMSKIIGYYIELNSVYVIDGDISIVYSTNRKADQTVTVLKENIREENYIYLELGEGEYVTDIKVHTGTLIGERLYFGYSGSAIAIAPIINTTRTYYDDKGEKQEVSFDKEYEISYEFTTSNPPAQYMTSENLKNVVVYKGYETYEIQESTPYYNILNSSGTNISSSYRGNTVQLKFRNLSNWSLNYKRNRIQSDYISLNRKYYFADQLLYFEVLPGFEIKSVGSSSILEKKEKLDNGNSLYVFRMTSLKNIPVSNPLEAELYIRPDASTEACNPIVAAGVSYEDYFREHFPDHPENEEQKNTFPYQSVTFKSQEKDNFPENWKLTQGEKVYGYCYSFTKPNGSDGFTVRNVTTSTTQMIGTRNGTAQGEQVSFKEAQREKIGFSAFIAASSATTLTDYTATFVIPKKDNEVQGTEKKYSAQYTLYAAGEMSIYLNGTEVNAEEKGISLTYYAEEESKITNPSKEMWDMVRKIEVHFQSLNDQEIYEVTMPLRADGKMGEDTSGIYSYIGTYNRTGTGETVYIDPITYEYKSYTIVSTFGLDKMEKGNTAFNLPIVHTLSIYDNEWETIYSAELKENSSASISKEFNGKGKQLAYVGFTLDREETENYLPTQITGISDILMPEDEGNIKVLSDGTKIWYLPIDEEDFIADSIDGKYDALFIRKPEITAEDITLAVDETGKLEFSVSQPVNKDIVKDYEISVRLLEENDDQKDIAEIQKNNTNDNYEVTGLKKGTVPYEVIVKNTQGMSFIAKANIIVGNKLYTPLPHVGGTGAGNFAFTGFILIAGGGAVAITRKRKKLPI